MRTESTVMPSAPITEASQLRWQQVLTFGCLPVEGSMAPHGPAVTPVMPATDVLP